MVIQLVKEHINQLETQVIRESSSPFASPMLVRKKNGSPRMCVDYRPHNSKTRSLDTLTGACWFSTLDLATGYNQVPVGEVDHPKTVFVHCFVSLNGNACLLALVMLLMQQTFGDQ